MYTYKDFHTKVILDNISCVVFRIIMGMYNPVLKKNVTATMFFSLKTFLSFERNLLTFSKSVFSSFRFILSVLSFSII